MGQFSHFYFVQIFLRSECHQSYQNRKIILIDSIYYFLFGHNYNDAIIIIIFGDFKNCNFFIEL